jgi:hypothetical protein
MPPITERVRVVEEKEKEKDQRRVTGKRED